MNIKLLIQIFLFFIITPAISQELELAIVHNNKNTYDLFIEEIFPEEMSAHTFQANNLDHRICNYDRIVALEEFSYRQINRRCKNPKILGLNKDLFTFHPKQDFVTLSTLTKKNLNMALMNYDLIAFIYSTEIEKLAYKKYEAENRVTIKAYQAKTPEEFAKIAGRLTSKVDAIVITSNADIVNTEMLKVVTRVSIKNGTPILGGPASTATNNGALAGFYYEYHQKRVAFKYWVKTGKLPLPTITFKLNRTLARYIGVSIKH